MNGNSSHLEKYDKKNSQSIGNLSLKWNKVDLDLST